MPRKNFKPRKLPNVRPSLDIRPGVRTHTGTTHGRACWGPGCAQLRVLQHGRAPCMLDRALFYPTSLGSKPLFFLVTHPQSCSFYQNLKISSESKTNHFISIIKSKEVDLTIFHLDLT